MRDDDSVELSLRSFRSLAYVSPDESNDGVISEEGRKTVRMRPGETLRIELPGPPSGVTDPGRHQDARVEAMRSDLTGHAFALIVRANAL